MLLVIFGHLVIFCSIGNENDFIKNIVLINMPLFLFLNGLVCSSIKNAWNFIAKTIRKILLPFISWGILITIFRHSTISDFFHSYWKFGYWYLLVLFEYYMVYVGLEFCYRKLKFFNNIKSYTILLIIVYFGFRFITKFIPYEINVYIDYFQFIEYLPYFELGLFLKKFNLTSCFGNNRYLFNITLLTSIFLYIIWYNIPLNEGRFYEALTICLRISLILTLLGIFLNYNYIYDYTRKFHFRLLSNIGRNTLSIYMIQFFLFRYIDLHGMCQDLYEEKNILFFIILILIVSILICYICMIIEKIINESSILSFILFGKLSNSHSITNRDKIKFSIIKGEN